MEDPTVWMSQTSRTAPGGFVRRESSPVEAPGGAYTLAGSATGTGTVRMGSMRMKNNVEVSLFGFCSLHFDVKYIFHIGLNYCISYSIQVYCTSLNCSGLRATRELNVISISSRSKCLKCWH